jgi:hypothetical protein
MELRTGLRMSMAEWLLVVLVRRVIFVRAQAPVWENLLRKVPGIERLGGRRIVAPVVRSLLGNSQKSGPF